MRKTRLVLIPGVKSLDTIGCLLLFLACPTIAFKGQENREVDTICKARSVKEFWVDSPWPGDTSEIGWVRGFGGGKWPGNSQEITCNGLSTRSVVRSRRSDDSRVQAHREASRDEGMETRKIRLENEMRRDAGREISRRVNSQNTRNSRTAADRTVLDEGRRMETRRLSETRAGSGASRSLDHDTRSRREMRDVDTRRDSRDRRDARVSSTEPRIITNRENVDGRRNSRAFRNSDREIRTMGEVRKPEYHRNVKEMTESNIGNERRMIRNREVIDGRRASRSSISQVDRSVRQIRTDSRAASSERIDTGVSEERVSSDERRNLNSRRVHGRTESRIATVERDVRSHKEIRDAAVRRDSQTRLNQRTHGERTRVTEMRVEKSRDIVGSRGNSVSPIRSVDRLARSEREFRTVSKLSGLPEKITGERRSSERRNADIRRDSTDLVQNQRRDIRLERRIRENESTVRSRISEGVRAADQRHYSVDYKAQEMQLSRQEREPERQRDSRFRRSTNMRFTVENRYENNVRRDSRLSTRSLDRQNRSERESSEMDHRQREIKSRSLDNVRTAAERRNEIRTLAVERRDDRRALERSIRLNRDISERRAERDMQEPKNLGFDAATRLNDFDAAGRRNSRLSVRSRERQSLSSRDNSLRERELDSRRTGVERVNRNIRSLNRVSRQVDDVERAEQQGHNEFRSAQRLQRSVRSSEDIRQLENRRETERKLLREGRNAERFSRGADERQNKRLVRDQSVRSQRVQRISRSLGDIRQSERRDRLVREEREIRRLDRTGDERLLESGDRERVSRRAAERGEIVETRSQLHMRRMKRDVRSFDDSRRFDRQSRQENRVVDNRRSELDRETRITASPERLSRLAADAERSESRQSQRNERVQTRLQEFISLNDVRRFDHRMQVTRNQRESSMSVDVREVENRRKVDARTQSRTMEDVRIFDHRVPVARNEREIARSDSRRVVSQRNLDRTQSRSLEDVRRFDRRMPDARNEREIARVDSRRKVETQRNFDTRTQSRSLEDIQRVDRQMPVGRSEQEIARLDNRRRVENQKNLGTRSQSRSMEGLRRLDRRMPGAQSEQEIAQSDSRRRVETLRNLDTRTQARSLDDVRRFDRRMPRNEQEIAKSDSRRRVATDTKTRSFIREREIRSVNNRLKTGRESRREIDHKNSQRRFESAGVRRQLESRDPEMRKLSKEISLKFDSVRAEEARRSERQRGVYRDLSRLADKRVTSLATESIRRFEDPAELTNKPRRLMNSQDMYSRKTNIVEQGQKLSLEENPSIFEFSKNALASWLSTDISRTDLNGIAETLMYGGIACFALFSNVNKKVIF